MTATPPEDAVTADSTRRPVDRDRFVAAVRSLDRPAFGAFVAAVFRAAGRDARFVSTTDPDVPAAEIDTESDTGTASNGAVAGPGTATGDGTPDLAVVVDGQRYVLDHPGRVRRRLGVGAESPPRADGASQLPVITSRRVPTDGETDETVIDVDALYDRVVYGLDPTARAALFDRLDCPATVSRTAPSPTADRAATTTGSWWPDRRVLLAVVALAAVVLGVGLTAGAGPGGPGGVTLAGLGDGGGTAPDVAAVFEGDPDSPADRTTVTPAATPTPTAAGVDGTDPALAPAAVELPANATLPPGVGPDGITNARRLADAHAEAVTGRAYELTISERTFLDGRSTAFRRERARVAGPKRFRTRVRSLGDPPPSTLIRSTPLYANGTTLVTRSGDEIRTDRLGPLGYGEGYYADRVERYIDWFLTVDESVISDTFVADGVRYYWVRLDGDPYTGVTDARGSALIDERGIVHEIYRESRDPQRRTKRTVTRIEYAFGPVDLTVPSWLSPEPDSGANATTTTTTTSAAG